MDVQTENVDPPPCESQPSGKIRKGFKLFGKRKPSNIFSIRSKGDGNNKSPVIKSKTLDGLSESPAPDSEQEQNKEKGKEVSEADTEQAEEEPLGEDGVLAAATARTSISSASSAKSLSFLSLLRGGRRGVGDRQIHTVSQPVVRQRRGLKGLFGNVKFRSKDKENKEEAPPSPLLMSSRANSVEIIKEDLTLTPKSQPRSLDSPETEHVKSLTTQDSAATSPSETITSQATTGNVSKTNEHVAPSPTSEPPLVPGDTSLSSLLADISSLLTFDSITGGGDIMADVEAEWGKASSIFSAVATEGMSSSTSLISKPTISSPLSSTTFSTASMAKSSLEAVPTTASSQSFTTLSKTTTTSSPISKPSTIITTFSKSSTLTTHSVKLSSYSTPASEPSASIKITTAPAPTTTKPSTVPVASANLSAPMSSSLITIKSTSSTSTTTTAPPNTPASVIKAPSVSPTLTSTASKLASEIAPPPQITASVSKPSPVATTPPMSTKPPPVTHSPPIPVAITQSPPAKSDSVSTSYEPSLSSLTGDSIAPVTVPTCTVSGKSSSPDPSILSKTMAPTSTTTSGSVYADLSKPTLTSTTTEQNKSLPSHVTVPDICPPTTKSQPSPACVPTPSSVHSDKLPPTSKPTTATSLLDKMPPTPTPIPTSITHAVSTTSSTPTALGQIPISLSKDQSAPAHTQVSQSKAPPATVQVPVSVCKDLPAPAHTQVSQSKAPPAPVQVPVSVCEDLPARSHMQISQPKGPPAPVQIPVSVCKDLPAPAQMQVSQSKGPPATNQLPVSGSTDSPALVPPAPISVSKPPSASAHIPVSQLKVHSGSSTAPCPVNSLPSTPTPQSIEAPASAKPRGSDQATVEGQLASPHNTNGQRVQTIPSKTEEPQNESRTSLPEPPREKRTQAKASGMSKIPVVGGGKVGKLPVRESQQHADEESNRNPPIPIPEEERPHFNSQDAGSKDKISAIEATSKHTQEDSQQPQHLKVLTSSTRDSKIPVKHGAQSHTASHIPQPKEPLRTKIPVSKVPVRRVGNKPAAIGGSGQIRK